MELQPPHPTDLFPNNQKEKEKKDQVVENKGSFHTLAHKEKDRLGDERVGCIVLPHLNLTLNSLNVLFDLAKELVCPKEQQGVIPELCQVCCSPSEQPSHWLASDLRLSGWFDSVAKKKGGEVGRKEQIRNRHNLWWLRFCFLISIFSLRTFTKQEKLKWFEAQMIEQEIISNIVYGEKRESVSNT